MNDFEKEYYESAGFWEGDMLRDPANQERIRFTTAYLPEDVHSLADIGCGNGVFVNHLLEKKPGLDILAVDRSGTALKYVRTNKLQASMFDLPLDDASFDCVTCLEVIEHLPVPVFEPSLQQLARIAKKYIIISVPYCEDLEESHNQCPQCKTIFNYELHLRRFDEATMRNLLLPYGFKCLKTDTLGEMLKFKGHYTFRKMFYAHQFRQWKSPICPLCGYEEVGRSGHSTTAPVVEKQQRSLVSYVTTLPKLFWPKEKKYYWIIALYQKET